MKTIKHIIFTAIISAFLFTSCEEVIDIDLNSSNPVINAEALIEEGEPATIRLMYSTDYFDGGEPALIENSSITIEDASGNSEILEYAGDGYYEGSSMIGEAGENYTLQFTNEDETFTASSELNAPVTIENISFEKLEINPIGSTETLYTIVLDFTNDESQENYYLFKFYIDGELMEGNYVLLEGNLVSNNGLIHIEPVRFRFEEAAELDVLIYSLDEETFIYYNQLNDISSEGFQSTSNPYNPTSNFGPDVMGFFEARSVATWSGIVQ